MIWTLLAPFRRAVAWALAGLAALAGLWVLAKRDARQETALEAAERYAKTRKAIDDAETMGDDPAVLRDWLHKRGQR